jgi:hypothetical protein
MGRNQEVAKKTLTNQARITISECPSCLFPTPDQGRHVLGIVRVHYVLLRPVPQFRYPQQLAAGGSCFESRFVLDDLVHGEHSILVVIEQYSGESGLRSYRRPLQKKFKRILAG